MSADAGYMLIRVDLQGAKQAAAEQAALNAQIVESGAATKAANAAATGSARTGSRAGKAWTTAGKAAKYGALGLAGAVAGLGYAGVKSVDHMQQLGLTAAGLRRNLDLTAESGSRWAAVAESRGIAPTALNMAFKTLATNLNSADREGGTYMDTFRQLGLTQEDVAKGTQDFDGFIQVIADRFGDMEGSAKRQAAAAKLLGRGYQSVLPLFSSGSKGLQEQLKWADKYNVTMGDKMVDSTVDLAMAQRESKVAWLGVQNVLAEEFMPAILDAHDVFQEFADVFTDPKLTTEEKVSILGDRLEEFAEKARDVFEEAMPKLANFVGQQAPKIAVGFVHGFLEADIWGKLVMGAWFFSMMTGGKMRGMIGKAGGKAALWFVTQFLKVTGISMVAGKAWGKIVAIMGPNGRWTKKLLPVLRKTGGKLAGAGLILGIITLGLADEQTRTNLIEFGKDVGEWIVNGLIDVLNEGIQTINDVIRTFNKLPGPDIGEIGEVGHIGAQYEGPLNIGEGPTLDEAGPAPGQELVAGPGSGGGGDGKGNKRSAGELPKGKVAGAGAGGGGDGDITIENKLYIDGKQVATATRRAARNKAARR